MFISVVLPEPEVPMRATNSPRAMVSEMPLSTGTSISPRLYVLCMSRSSINSMAALVIHLHRHEAASDEWLFAIGGLFEKLRGKGAAARGRLSGRLALHFAHHQGGPFLEFAARNFRQAAVAQPEGHLDRTHQSSLGDPNDPTGLLLLVGRGRGLAL